MSYVSAIRLDVRGPWVTSRLAAATVGDGAEVGAADGLGRAVGRAVGRVVGPAVGAGVQAGVGVAVGLGVPLGSTGVDVGTGVDATGALEAGAGLQVAGGLAGLVAVGAGAAAQPIRAARTSTAVALRAPRAHHDITVQPFQP